MAGRTINTLLPWAAVSLITLEVLVWGVVVSPGWVAGEIQEERRAVARWIGPELEYWLWDETRGLYNKVAVDSGAQEASEEFAEARMAEGELRTQQVAAWESWRTEWIDERLTVLGEVFRQALFRAGVLMLIGIYCLPAVAASVVDALVIRARRRAQAQMPSPRVYHLSKRLLTAAAVGPVLILLSPVSISPAWMLGWAALVVWLVWGVMQHAEAHI